MLFRSSYVNGEHVFTGVVDMPTPCHEIAASTLVAQTFPEHVTIALTMIPPKPGMACAQVISEKQFTVRYKASATAVGQNITVTLDGKPVLFIVGEKD